MSDNKIFFSNMFEVYWKFEKESNLERTLSEEVVAN